MPAPDGPDQPDPVADGAGDAVTGPGHAGPVGAGDAMTRPGQAGTVGAGDGPRAGDAGPPVGTGGTWDRALWAGVGVGLVLALAMTLLRGDAMWSSSEGVYAQTARQLLDGDDLYSRLVAAQPPVSLYAGVLPLLISDTLDAIHVAMALCQLAGGALAAVAVRRLTGSSVATAVTPVAAVLLPWAVNQHGVYTPELVGLPLLMGAGVLAARERGAPWAGILLALAVFTKLPFVVPAVLVALVAADRRRTAGWLVGALVVQVVAYTLLFSTAIWDQTILAQRDSGFDALGSIPGVAVQTVWNLLGLLVGCALLLRHRASWPADRLQLRVSAALALGTAVTWISTTKDGTSLNVTVPIELALVPVAVTGFVLAWRSVGPASTRGARAVGRWALPVLAALAFAQSVAVLVPPHDAFPWVRPGSPPTFGQSASEEFVHETVEAARTKCAPDAPFGGLAYYAFLADRRMPDGQPDTFLTKNSDRLEPVLDRMLADGPYCGG
ncbi:hypothetical protein [Patulibacter sp.]|uniref:hypothetical protein n=1 Tax=Patulibacter sp. TaxID=1912859 RepID=UPI0027240669|nr:hypothetical protein [Patulibacter sp.]MDO9409492.1 hypothetical protein [Patulibacter sp.]